MDEVRSIYRLSSSEASLFNIISEINIFNKHRITEKYFVIFVTNPPKQESYLRKLKHLHLKQIIMEDLWILVIAIICTIGLPIITGLVLGLRWMKTRNEERMGLINQGIIPPDTPKRKSDPNKMVSLRNGIVLISLGIGIIVGFLCSEYLVIGHGNEFWVTGASVVFFLGIGYLVYFLVTQKMPLTKQKAELEQE